MTTSYSLPRKIDNRANSDEPLISVVTVVLNGELLLEDTILSVISQKNKHIEYIIIDGASSDGTLGIIKKYSSHIDFWISEPDRGVYEAMNKGIMAATGRCVGLLNCGDRYERDTLEVIAKKLSQIPDKYFAIAGGINMTDELGVVTDTFLTDASSLKNQFLLMPLNHPAMFVSSSIYTDIAIYNPELRIASDYEFVLMLLQRNINVFFVPSVLTNMRSGGISETPSTIFVRLKECFRIRRKYKGLGYCLLVSLREAVSFLLRLANIRVGFAKLYREIKRTSRGTRY